MTITLKPTILLVCGALALAACTDPNRLGGDGSGDALGGQPAAGAIVPGSASDPTSAAYFQQSVGDRVLFLVDQSSLTPQGQATLDGQAAWLATNAGYTAVIEGHADEQGTREYNLALGARRADAVRNYLISKGVSGDRLRVVSYGKERPAELCSAESCYAQNRRSVTVLAGGLSS